jgi:hypothetical protein
LHDIERTELGRRGDVAPAPNHAGVVRGIELSSAHGWQSRLQVRQGCGQAFQVLGIGIRNQVQILSTADESVRSNCHAADHYEAHVVVVQGRKQ